MEIIIDRIYDKPIQIENIIGDFDFITFTTNFKYLGLWISYDLNDNYYIEFRIRKDNQVMDALHFFGNV